MDIRKNDDLFGLPQVDALHVTGDTPEQAAAIDALEGAHLIEIVEH